MTLKARASTRKPWSTDIFGFFWWTPTTSLDHCHQSCLILMVWLVEQYVAEGLLSQLHPHLGPRPSCRWSPVVRQRLVDTDPATSPLPQLIAPVVSVPSWHAPVPPAMASPSAWIPFGTPWPLLGLGSGPSPNAVPWDGCSLPRLPPGWGPVTGPATLLEGKIKQWVKRDEAGARNSPKWRWGGEGVGGGKAECKSWLSTRRCWSLWALQRGVWRWEANWLGEGCAYAHLWRSWGIMEGKSTCCFLLEAGARDFSYLLLDIMISKVFYNLNDSMIL